MNLDLPVSALDRLDEADQALRDRVHEALSSRCEYDHLTDCWVYTGPWMTQGAMGRMRVGARSYRVARVAAWVYKGFELWRPLSVYVTCECNACFNPKHLAFRPRASAEPATILRPSWMTPLMLFEMATKRRRFR